MAGESIQKLRDLYEKNRQFLDEQESKIAHPIVENNYIYNILLRDDLSSKLEKASSDFEFQALNTLDDFPEKPYKEKIVKATKSKEELPFSLYPAEFHDLVFKQAVFSAKLDALLEIIKDYEAREANIEKIAYSLNYDNISGRLWLNETVIHRCKTNSFLGSALDKAINNSSGRLKMQNGKNLASALPAFKMPNELRKIMFRARKETFIVKAKITYRELEQNNLDKEKLDKELERLQNN